MNMKKILFSTFLAVFAFCGLARADYPARTKIYFTFHTPFTVKAGEVLVAPGDYAIRDLGISPNAVLSLTEKGKTEPLAILYAVRIDRRLIDWTDKPHIIFDNEGSVPAIKKFFVTSEDGYEIISAVGKKYKATGVVNVTKTETVVETPAPAAEPAPEPAPRVEPAPEPEPRVEPAPEPKQEPVAPIQERKRVRKD